MLVQHECSIEDITGEWHARSLIFEDTRHVNLCEYLCHGYRALLLHADTHSEHLSYTVLPQLVAGVGHW